MQLVVNSAMAQLPVPQNVTVDIYRNADPTAPRPDLEGSARPSEYLRACHPAVVAQVSGNIKPVMTSGRFGSALYLKWTHLLILPAGTDIRDAYNSQLDPSRSNNAADTVVVTDSQGNAVPYYVVFVEQAYRGSAKGEPGRFQAGGTP